MGGKIIPRIRLTSAKGLVEVEAAWQFCPIMKPFPNFQKSILKIKIYGQNSKIRNGQAISESLIDCVT